MNITEINLSPVHVCKVGSLEFRTLVSSVADHIKDSGRLWPAYLDFCQAKGFDPDEYLPKYAAYQVETSCADTSTDTDSDGNKETFGTFHLEDALFATLVNLLGCPHITNYLKTELSPYKIHTHFCVMDGHLCGTVELVGDPDTVNANNPNNRTVRDILRLYGFGDIETMDSATDEGNGLVSVATLASRTLP